MDEEDKRQEPRWNQACRDLMGRCITGRLEDLTELGYEANARELVKAFGFTSV